uniref:Uncharacterized protein n=1 Tax=Salix viminalis TaxID=40686 RepID=A0A6N2K8N5_SALVM
MVAIMMMLNISRSSVDTRDLTGNSVLVELHFYVVEASRKLLDLCTMRKTLTSIQGEMLLNHLSYVDSSNVVVPLTSSVVI